MFMFFFGAADPAWWEYREQLGIQGVVENLKQKNLPSDWPMQTVDLSDPATLKAEATKGSYKSQCPHYEGYWLCGGTGSVECKAFEGLLPGIVWYKTCSKDHHACPLFRRSEDKCSMKAGSMPGT